MSMSREDKSLILAVGGFLLSLTWMVLVLGVAVHFIRKYW